MDNKKLVLDLREYEDLQTIKKTENEDIASLFHQKPEQTNPFGKKIQKGQQLWKEFYRSELIKYKKINPQATHNELTSQISKKWKRKKQNKKIINKLNLKIKHENITEITISSNNVDQIVINNEEEQKDEIIEKLKTSTFKLIYLDYICELKGQIILEALKNNTKVIQINKSNEITNQDISCQYKQKSTKNIRDNQENKQVQQLFEIDSDNDHKS